MPIYFDDQKRIFEIITYNSKYAFQIVNDKFLVHLYYGDKNKIISEYSPTIFTFAPNYEKYDMSYLPDTCMSECVGFDSGDFRSYSLKVKNFNGDSSTVPEYKSHRIFKGRIDLPDLPYCEADGETETLEVVLFDRVTEVEIKIYFSVVPKEDIISNVPKFNTWHY